MKKTPNTEETPNDALRVDNAAPEPVLQEKLPSTEQIPAGHSVALVMYLIDSAYASVVEPPDFFFFDIDCDRFARPIEEAEKLTPSARLALAISLLSEVMIDVMVLEQQSTQSVLRALVLKGGVRS